MKQLSKWHHYTIYVSCNRSAIKGIILNDWDPRFQIKMFILFFIIFQMSSSTATMIPRGSHRQQAGSNIADSSNNSTSSSSSNSVSSTINRITNSFQVNVNGGLKKGPPVPPNKPAVSLPKPLAKFEGIVSTSDARKGAIDLAKWELEFLIFFFFGLFVNFPLSLLPKKLLYTMSCLAQCIMNCLNFW